MVFREGSSVILQSKACKPLMRYFPELVEAMQAVGEKCFVLDGEIVMPHGSIFSFDHLLQRIHPAESRVRKLARETPAFFIAFDLLADTRGPIDDRPLHERRKRLEAFAKKNFEHTPSIRLSIMTLKASGAKAWLARVGAALDGIIAKRRDLEYRAGDRSGMQKIKNLRSADFVIGGFRYGAGQKLD